MFNQSRIKNLQHDIHVERQFRHAVTPCQSESCESGRLQFKGIETKIWQVGAGDVVYCNDNVHTLSLYIDGGEHSFRKDKRSLKGGAGKLCLMPKGHQSSWSIRDNIRFLHFYFSENQLNEFITQNFDSDVRLTSIVEQVYAQNPQLAHQLIAYHKLSNNQHACGFLHRDEMVNTLLYVIVNQCTDNAPKRPLTGGLSQKNIKRITSFINENIEQTITLDMLASEVN